jgi:uncharacterized membrane protein YjdF
MRHIFLKYGKTVKTSFRFYIVTKLKKRKIFIIFQFPVFIVLPNLRKENKYFSFSNIRFYIVTKLKKRKQIFLIFQFPVFTVLPNLRKENKYFSFSNLRFLQCYQT